MTKGVWTMSKMNKRVYGVLGISSVMANWNADFEGFPKATTKEQFFGSDKALKYPMKKMWEELGEKVLNIKSLRLKADKKGEVNLVPRTLKERYEYIFDVEDLKKVKDTGEILKNLFTAVDVKNFGATFAEVSANVSITGAVQIGQGFNLYEASEIQQQTVLSPFKNPKEIQKKKDNNEDDKEETNKEEEVIEKKNTSLGTKIVSDEAHYFYPFVINPRVYDSFEQLGVTEGYTEEDYQKFKEAALKGTTSFATNSKAGCENEFGLFIETEPTLYLPNLDRDVTFIKGAEKNTIQVNVKELLHDIKDRVLSAEIHYNPHTTEIASDIEGVKYFDIFTGKEIEKQ